MTANENNATNRSADGRIGWRLSRIAWSARGRRSCVWLAGGALLALTLTVIACSRHADSTSGPPATPVAAPVVEVPVRVGRVELRPVQRMVPSVGTLQGYEEITLTPEVEGRVLRIYHEAGDRVQPGELLLELDPTDYRLAVAEARRALDLELARLGVSEVPGEDFVIDELPSIVRATNLLRNATRHKDRVNRLRERRVATEEEWDQAETNFKVATADLQQATLEARATIAAARQRQAALDTAEKRLADTRIVAPPFPRLQGEPAEGAEYVVAERMVSEGEMVRAFPSTAVMRLVVDRLLKLTTPIPERYMGEVKVGQPVKLLVDAYSEEIFDGQVTLVRPTVDPASHTFVIEAVVDNTAGRLKAGAFAKLAILTRIEPRAVTVPLEAMVTFAGVRKVFVVRDGVAFGVEVKPSVRGDGWLEVIGDLHEGDLVVTAGQSKLADETPVRILDADVPAVAERSPR